MPWGTVYLNVASKIDRAGGSEGEKGQGEQLPPVFKDI